MAKTLLLVLLLLATSAHAAALNDSTISVKVFQSQDGNLHAGDAPVAGAEVCFEDTEGTVCPLTDANGNVNQAGQSGSAVTVTLTIPTGFICTAPGAACQAVITTHPFENRLVLWGVYPNAAHIYLPLVAR